MKIGFLPIITYHVEPEKQRPADVYVYERKEPEETEKKKINTAGIIALITGAVLVLS